MCELACRQLVRMHFQCHADVIALACQGLLECQLPVLALRRCDHCLKLRHLWCGFADGWQFPSRARSPALTARTSVPPAVLACTHEVILCRLIDRSRLDRCGLCHRRGLMRPLQRTARVLLAEPAELLPEACITCSVVPTSANKADCSAKNETRLEYSRIG